MTVLEPRNGKSDGHLLPSTMLLCTRFCGVMGGFARGTVAIVNFSDREHSFHLNEMAGSEASTASTSVDLEQPKVSHEALPHLRFYSIFLADGIFLATYQTTSSMLFERHPLHQEGCIWSACVLLTVSINRCFDTFLILAKRGILFVLPAFLQLPLYFLLADRDSKHFNKHGGKALGLITFELKCSISAEPYSVANQISQFPRIKY